MAADDTTAAGDVRPEIRDEGADPAPAGNPGDRATQAEAPGPLPGTAGDEVLAEHIRARIEQNREIVWHQAAVACLQGGDRPEVAAKRADEYLRYYAERMIQPGKPFFGKPGDQGDLPGEPTKAA